MSISPPDREASYQTNLAALLSRDREQCHDCLEQWLATTPDLRRVCEDLGADLAGCDFRNLLPEFIVHPDIESLPANPEVSTAQDRWRAQHWLGAQRRPPGGRSARRSYLGRKPARAGRQVLLQPSGCRPMTGYPWFGGPMNLDYLLRTALWVFRACRARGFHTRYWPANLDTFVEITRVRSSAAGFAEVYPSFYWLIVNVPSFVHFSDAQQAEPSPAEPRHDSAEPAS